MRTMRTMKSVQVAQTKDFDLRMMRATATTTAIAATKTAASTARDTYTRNEEPAFALAVITPIPSKE